MLKDHVWTKDASRDRVLTAEVTHLKHPRGRIPIVAAARTTSIDLYHWRESVDMWGSLSIDHEDSLNVDVGGPDFTNPEVSMLDKLSHAGWSHRIGLATGLGLLFLVFRRSIDGKKALYIDVFRLSSDADKLERVTPKPVAVPYDKSAIDRTGYYLWAGYAWQQAGDPDAHNRLVILTQTYESSSSQATLTYLAIDAVDAPDHYDEPANWTTRNLLDQSGGYNVDARVDGADIHAIFRQHEYPLSYGFPNMSETAATNGVIAPLHYIRLRAQDGTVLDHEDELPGGEHPQLQCLDPLAYTVDRKHAGRLTMDMNIHPTYLQYAITHSRKHLLLRADGDWTDTPLMVFRENWIPTFPFPSQRSWTIADPILFVPTRSTPLLNVSRVRPPMPVYIPEITWDDGTLDFDMLHHNFELGALVMTHVRHCPRDASLGPPNLKNYAILNINHEYIPEPVDTDPWTIDENRNFLNADVPPLDGKTGAFQWTLRDTTQVFNHTGGDFAMERAETGARQYVYVHNGDGNVRLIPGFTPFLAQTVANPSTELHDPDAVTGTGYGVERTVTHRGDWLGLNVPLHPDFYTAGSTLYSGLDDRLHSIILLAATGMIGDLSDDKRTLTLTRQNTSGTPEGEVAWESLIELLQQVEEDIATESDLLTGLGMMTLEISKFTITVDPVTPMVIIKVGDDYRTQYRFMTNSSGQGKIQSRFLGSFSAPAVQLTEWLRPLARASIEVDLDVRRDYTPAVLMSDVIFRSSGNEDRLDFGNTQRSALFTAKPVGDAIHMPIDARPSFEWTVGGHVLIAFLPLIIELLAGLGLGWLATSLGGLAADMAASAASIIGIVVAVGFYVALVLVLEQTVPGEFKKLIVNSIQEVDLNEMLEDNDLLTNAGEGIAEDIAWRVLDEDERVQPGDNRYKQGVWRMVYVTGKECRVFMEDM